MDGAGAAIALCDGPLTSSGLPVLLEDPLSIEDLESARAAAQQIRLHLAAWPIGDMNSNRTLVNRTFAELRAAHVAVDGPGVRNLFFFVQRFTVASRDVALRLGPLADVLRLSPADTGRLVNMVLQLDSLAYRRDVVSAAPKFLFDALDGETFITAELGAKLTPPLRAFLHDTFIPILRQRLRYVRLSLNQEGTQLIVRTPDGVYRINLTDRVFERPAIAEPHVSVSQAWGLTHDQVIHAQIEISTADVEQQIYLRTTIRSDAFLHPHAALPATTRFPQPTVPSDWQEESVIGPLLKLDSKLVAEHASPGPILIGLQQSVGTGKTPSGIAYLQRVPSPLPKKPGVRNKHIVVVENTHLLTQSLRTYQRDTGARPEKIALLYGDTGFEELKIGVDTHRIPRGHKLTPPADWDLIFITRSTFISRKSSLAAMIGAENAKAPGDRRAFRVTIDEGQHVGTDEGEFDKILDFLDQKTPARRSRVAGVGGVGSRAH